MANSFTPNGFSHIAGTGSEPTFEQVERKIAASNVTQINTGDPVVSLATGYITLATPGTTQVAGIFIGCKYLSVSQGRTVWSPMWPGADASGDVTAYIINDPNAQFEVQAGPSSATQPITMAAVNNNVNFGIGTPAMGRSGAFVDTGTIATTATLPFRIVALKTFPGGANGTDTTTAFNRVIVAFNNVDTKSLTGI